MVGSTVSNTHWTLAACPSTAPSTLHILSLLNSATQVLSLPPFYSGENRDPEMFSHLPWWEREDSRAQSFDHEATLWNGSGSQRNMEMVTSSAAQVNGAQSLRTDW